MDYATQGEEIAGFLGPIALAPVFVRGAKLKQVGNTVKPVIQKLPHELSVQDVGKNVIGWRTGSQDAVAVTRSMTTQQAEEILNQVSRQDIQAIGDWYRSVAKHLQKTNPAALKKTPTPLRRAEMMDRILHLGGKP